MKGKVSTVAAAILAGGKNSRMFGRNKAFIKIHGTPIIHRTIETLKDIFEEVIIVTNSAQKYTPFKKNAVIITDRIKNSGPLGGIFSALSQTTKGVVFFVGCDMPFLHNELIQRELEYFKTKNCDVLVPRIGSSIEPLHAIYKESLKDSLGHFVTANNHYSIRDFLKTINVCYWDLEDVFFNREAFRNLNTQEDVEEIQGLYYAGKIKDLV